VSNDRQHGHQVSQNESRPGSHRGGFHLALDNFAHISGSQTPWRTAMPLPAGLQNSHQNGGSLFLIFVADPRTRRLCS